MISECYKFCKRNIVYMRHLFSVVPHKNNKCSLHLHVCSLKIGYLLPLNSQLKFYSEIEKGKPLEPGKSDFIFSFMLYMIQKNAEDLLFIVSSCWFASLPNVMTLNRPKYLILRGECSQALGIKAGYYDHSSYSGQTLRGIIILITWKPPCKLKF